MKILVVCSNPPGWGPPPVIGGAERRVQEVCARWRSDGHTVIVIEGPSGPSHSMDAQWEYQSISLPIWHGGTFHALRLTRRFWMEAVRIGKLYSGRVDVVVSATSCLSDVITSRTIAKDLKVPWALVVVIHAYGSSFLATLDRTRLDAPPAIAFVRALTGTLAMRLARKASCVFCISEPIAQALREGILQPDRVHVTGMGLDLPTINRVAPHSKHRNLLYMGRIEEGKGVGTAIRVLARLVTLMPDVHLSLLGAGSWTSEANTLASRLGVDDRLEWIGYIPGTERFSILKSADVMLFPSQSEGFGLAVTEAIACGLPIALFQSVAQNFPDDIPLLFSAPDGDIDALSDAAIKAISVCRANPDIKYKGSKHAERFDWEIVARKEVALLESLIMGKGLSS